MNTLHLGGGLLAAALLGACASVGQAPEVPGTATRPQLTAGQAALATPAVYFAQMGSVEELKTDPWDPVERNGVTDFLRRFFSWDWSRNEIGDVTGFKPAYTVAADGSGTHKTLQSALDAAVAKGGSDRVYILVKPGIYRGQTCLKGGPPVTLYGLDGDASKVVIVDNKSNGTPKPKELVLNACEGRSGADSYGTSGSTTFMAYADGFQAKNLTFSNDFDESSASRGLQAVAVTTRGDKQIYENVRFLGNQDTLQVSSSNLSLLARAYFSKVYIEGDTDYVFGRGIAVFDQAEFKSLAREGSEGGYVFAPSHAQIFPVGFLAVNSKFTSDGKLPAGGSYLGRPWDDSSGTYTAKDGSKHLPNGLVVVRDSVIGAHISVTEPWAPGAGTKRPYSSTTPQTIQFGNPKAATTFPVNRHFEYRNSTLK
ncbi:MAG: acyl-CoA thioesterase [Candidatus Dactylopiibacterium carminicum]|uniref:Pectinesterase n=1 Tax=Candidatus Dactylopiibacterium carminicum TaxID=857335 RepID=A0A272ENR7_9RHOO|nr:pectinesterase family protein [Candidatus Dactylopiibacterium carminicum]KAF7599548.1 acyl-CoA thioesterase [Candidatus Dactylopiibacterium carminicum]PAS91767.1 MAG: acyl-CoA thioesterase [Candidatus Dactylopiibacterium carminicum]PAS92656.1 MAG: acyl-CoA thioesterase [Candidatus Dactylopiibacterium carminicum]PAS99551.1 MAG: hypothetical protein BSR46_07235 [Candidatus Dactylopiibacterium carminicum]